MVPVSGLLQPTEIRPDIVAIVPLSKPGAMTSLLSAPNGWQSGGTSLETIADVSALPPMPSYSPIGSSLTFGPPSAPMFILSIFMKVPSFLPLDMVSYVFQPIKANPQGKSSEFCIAKISFDV
jgi:hypothetical protein